VVVVATAQFPDPTNTFTVVVPLGIAHSQFPLPACVLMLLTVSELIADCEETVTDVGPAAPPGALIVV
jgi:hypothetical protein